jgi:hypothetical protein
MDARNIVKVKNDVTLWPRRDTFKMELERCACCGGIITCECKGTDMSWYCDKRDPSLACEHALPDTSCALGGDCSGKEGGKLNTPEANRNRRVMISYAGYEIFRILCQHGTCVATSSDEVMRALAELSEMLDIHVYKDPDAGKVFVVPAGSEAEEFFTAGNGKGMKRLA